MIVSTEWLKQFVDIKESPAELADLLSGVGLDAEFTGIQDSIEGIVIGRVNRVEKHPNADKLSLCIVSDGNNEFQVVCGAPNVAEDQTIAYASVFLMNMKVYWYCRKICSLVMTFLKPADNNS